MTESVSVIVPVYNVAPYLSRTLQSLAEQTLELEVICVDDGSWDDSGSLGDVFALSNAGAIIIHKKNEGVTKARLTGVQAASGNFIGFCDGDDTVETVMYERLLGNLLKYQADISHCGHRVVYVDGRTQDFYNTGRLAKQDRTEGLKDLLSGSFEPGLWSKLYRKTLLHSLLHSGKMDIRIKYNEDLLMNYYLFREAAFSVYEDICLYNYLKREGSACETSLKYYHIQDPLRVWKSIEIDCKGTEEESLAKCMKMSRYLNIYNDLIYAGNDYYIHEQDEIRRTITGWQVEKKYLDKKRRIMVWMIKYVPYLYRYIYLVYRRAGV